MEWKDLDRYDYVLPPELIRRAPLEPRDSARLMVYDTTTDTITFDTFRNLAQFLPHPGLLVLNESKVWPARLNLRKETGGGVELLVLVNEYDEGEAIPVLSDRKLVPGQKIFFPDQAFFTVERQTENRFYLRLTASVNIFVLLERFGVTPIPHYLKGEMAPEEARLRSRYQSVFAKSGASVAAPTASLHFTPAVLSAVRERGLAVAPVTLNVGLGTFAPLREENFTTHTLHPERVTVPHATLAAIAQTQALGQPLVAVGTTVIRTLESLPQPLPSKSWQASIDTFIFPPYTFQRVDAVVTNFHLPKTSLMLLIDAFLEHKRARKRLLELYRLAIGEKLSFYSFGDSLLIR